LFESDPNKEEEINSQSLQTSQIELRVRVDGDMSPGTIVGARCETLSEPSTCASARPFKEGGKKKDPGGLAGRRRSRCTWGTLRPILLLVSMTIVVVLSAFLQGWLDSSIEKDRLRREGGTGESSGFPSLKSLLRYGTIPVVAAVIGYGTNVVALWMMFYPLDFVGFFPQARIGCGLDLPLFGWQGVIPMKAQAMAEISVDMMTAKLINVEEVFARLDPQRVAQEVSDILPDIISDVVNEAGRKHCPKLWEYLPSSARQQIEDNVLKQSGELVMNFFRDLQRNIEKTLDLKHCTVERLVNNRELLNDMFLTCGKEEFAFIRVSGFYLGFFFGVIQMIVWMFIKDWWILPMCGVFVGYLTNVVALKVIFAPIQPRSVCGLFTVQGLFLQRQAQVSALYARMVSEQVLHASVLINALLEGPRNQKAFQLVDKHVAKSMEDVGSYYKPAFLLYFGAETWAGFRQGLCTEFRGKLPTLMNHITDFAQDSLQLETTLRERMEKLPAPEFERLLHAVFEQDEIKLIIVGAVLGAIVGFIQAMAQTPEQLGIAF